MDIQNKTQREIKFRLRIRNRIVGYEKWYCGHQVEGDPCSAQPCWLYSEDNERWFPMFPNYKPHTHKDQFTGFRDKKGKECFEGDKVHNNLTTRSGIVKWDDLTACFAVTDKNGKWIASMGAFNADGFTILLEKERTER